MRVLLVEDEYQITDALSIILKKNKMNVDIAHDGIEGQAFAESKIYDVIVLDRMLPKRDGLQVLIHLRQQGIRTPRSIPNRQGFYLESCGRAECRRR